MSLDAIAPLLDLAALVYFFLAIGIYRLIVSSQALGRKSLAEAVQRQRLSWMINMARRENRMLDAILLGSLGQGNAFFASTSAIAVGGLAATLGVAESACRFCCTDCLTRLRQPLPCGQSSTC